MTTVPSFNIGIEEEYQIIDPETRELKSYITQLIEEAGKMRIFESMKPELHQSMVEVGTQAELLERDGRYADFLELQLGKAAVVPTVSDDK